MWRIIFRSVDRKPLRFALIGAYGFLIDAGVLQALAWLGVNLFVGRTVSYLFAAVATWGANRALTFGAQSKSLPGLVAEWLHYVLASLAGGVVNYAAFTAAVISSQTIKGVPTIGVAIGAVAGMCVNYFLYSKLVFHSRK